MVAKEMALRVIQLTPWRARTSSVSSERDLFCGVLGSVGLLFCAGGTESERGAEREVKRRETYHHPLAGEVLDCDFWWCGHFGGMMWLLSVCLKVVSRGSCILVLVWRLGMPNYVLNREKVEEDSREQLSIYNTAISALNVDVDGTFPTRWLWSMPRCDVMS
jgi:hypothetical protein